MRLCGPQRLCAKCCRGFARKAAKIRKAASDSKSESRTVKPPVPAEDTAICVFPPG